jgi:hypothetical protein
MDPLAELRGKINELRTIDPATIAARAQVLDQRVILEDEAEALSRDLDVDREVVLFTINAAWSERLLSLTDDTDPAAFRAVVRADVETVCTMLAFGSPGLDPVHRRIRARVIKDGRSGRQPIEVKRVLLDTSKMISAAMPG